MQLRCRSKEPIRPRSRHETTQPKGKDMTVQEMFDKAWIGATKQGWKHSYRQMNGDRKCVYQSPEGYRCGWGLVDTSLGPHTTGPTGGLAASLNANQLDFAVKLQVAHDSSVNANHPAASWKEQMVALASEYCLTIPEAS